jgi:hypothetical protein
VGDSDGETELVQVDDIRGRKTEGVFRAWYCGARREIVHLMLGWKRSELWRVGPRYQQFGFDLGSTKRDPDSITQS